MIARLSRAGRGHVPLESLLLGLSVVVLLSYPLLRFRADDAQVQGPLQDPCFLTALRQVEGSTVALYRLQEEPGWPSVTDRPRVAIRHRLPAHWMVVRLVVESFGATGLPAISPEVIRVEARLPGGEKVHAFPLYRQLEGLPGSRLPGGVPAGWREPLHGRSGEGGYDCRQLLLVLQQQVPLEQLIDPVLHLGRDLELAMWSSREP